MAVNTSGLDSRLALPGLTVMLALFAFWLGTRRPDAIAAPRTLPGAVIATCGLLLAAFWLGARNPDLFGSLPILGKAAD